MSHETLSTAGVELRRPFAPAAIRIKPQTVSREAPFRGLVTFYLDARLVVERLNTVVGAGEWSDEYRVLSLDPLAGVPTECRLTVLGVTKADVGQIDPDSKHDNKSVKSAYSDALKRAAVKFGVGAFLYNLPSLWVEVAVVNGKARGFTEAGRQAAMAAYREWLESPHQYGEPLDHGDQENPADVIEVGGPSVEVPQTWPQVEEAVSAYGPDVWREFQALMRAAREAEPGFSVSSVFRQAAAGVAVQLLEAHDPAEFPPPSLEDLQQAWAPAVAGAILTPVYPEDEPQAPDGGSEAKEDDGDDIVPSD